MKNIAKKLISFLLVVVMVLGTAPTSAFAAQAEQINAKSENRTTWNFNSETGVLTVSGSGDTDSLINPSDYPWYIYKEEIKSVVIENGVTSVGTNAFAGYMITSATIASTVKYIGDGAFENCLKLSEINVDESFTGFGTNAFAGTAHYADTANHKNGAYYINDTLVEVEAVGTDYTIPSDTLAVADFAVVSSSITNVNIPANVKYIGSRAFAQATSLVTITVAENSSDFCSDESGALYSKDMTKLICVPGDAENMSKTYTISYYIDGELVHTELVEENKAIPEYVYDPGEGRTFMGWNNLPETMPEKDIDIYGTCSVNTYTITYILDEELFTTVEYSYGSKVVAPEYDAPLGYAFSGWRTPETMPAENLTLKATLSVCTYNAIFYLDDEQTMIHATVPTAFGEQIKFPADPQKPNSVFLGWDNDSTVMDTEGKAYVAIWADVEFLVEFFYFNGDIERIEAYSGQIINENDIPEATFPGYIFNGWEDEDGKTVTFPITVTSNMRFYSVFVPGESEYSVEIYEMDIDGEYRLVEIYGCTATTDSLVTYEPEVKEGFTVDASLSKLEDYVTSDGIINLYVYYSRNKYNVTIDGVKNQYYYGETISLPTADKVGMDFNGWYDNQGNRYEDSFTVSAQDTVLNPIYTVKNYTVKFRVDGEDYDTLSCNYGSLINAPAAPEKEGYSFAGWMYDGKFASFPITVLTDGMVFDAVYTANPQTMYMVNIYLMGTDGKYPATPSKTEVKSGVVGTTVTVSHSDFAQEAWFSADKSAANVTSGKVSIDGSTVLKLYYTRAKYAVTIDGVKAADVYHGATFTVPESDSTPAGYVHTGYNNGAYAVGDVITVTSSLSLTSDYTASSTIYTVELYYMGADGKYGEPVCNTETTTTHFFVSVSHEDYPCDVWFSADEDADNVTFATVSGDGSTVLKLYYKRNMYTVSFDGVDYQAYYGAVIPVPENPTKEGYTFAGWCDENGKTPADYGTMSTEKLSFTSCWNAMICEYEVRIYEMNTSGRYPRIATSTKYFLASYGETVTAEYTVPEGFSLDSSKSVVSGVITSEDLILKVYLARNLCNVTYMVDGVELESAKVYYGSTVYDTYEGSYLWKYSDGTEVSFPFTVTGDTVLYGEIPSVQEPIWEIKEGITYNEFDDMIVLGGFGAGLTEQQIIDSFICNEFATVRVTANKSGKYSTGAAAEIYDVNTDELLATYYIAVQGDLNGDGAMDADDGYIVYDETLGVTCWSNSRHPDYDPVKIVAADANSDGILDVMDFTQLGFVWYIIETYIMHIGGAYSEGEFKDFIGVAGQTVTAETNPDMGYVVNTEKSVLTATLSKGSRTTLSVYYDIQKYTITYVIQDDTVTVEYYYGEDVEMPGNPEVANYTFIGWDTEIPETMPAENLVITANFEKVPVKLIPAEGSTTVIDREEMLIYGLNVRRFSESSILAVLDVQGDGFIEITPNELGRYSTGALVEVWDNSTMEVTESFHIIFFGDINGDSMITSLDVSYVYDEALYLTSWSRENSETYNYYMLKAVDLDHDGIITTTDSYIVFAHALDLEQIDQVTGCVGSTDFNPRTQDGMNLNIATKIFKQNSNGEWIETEKVKAGDNVKARVYLDTDFYSGSGSILLHINNNFYDIPYESDIRNNLNINDVFHSECYDGGYFALSENANKFLVDNGKISEDFAENYSAITACYYFEYQMHKIDGSEWFFEFDLKVKQDASGNGDILVVDSATASPSFPEGITNIAKGAYNERPSCSFGMNSWQPNVSYQNSAVTLSTPSTITFVADGGVFANGSSILTVEGDSGEALPEIETPVREGSYFAGWSEYGSFITGLPEVFGDYDITFYAVFESNFYNVTHNVYTAEGTLYKSLVVGNREFGDVIPLKSPLIEIPEGYVLSPAYADKEFTEVYPEGARMPSKDVNVYFMLVPLDYVAIFDANGGAWADGETQKTITASFDSQIIAPEAPEKEGCRFMGWTPDVGIMDEDIKVFTATWEKDTYNVTYYVDGSCYEFYPLTFGEEMDIPADPYKKGYVFVGWIPAIPETMPAEDISFTADFEPNEYNAVFDANGGAWSNGETQKFVNVPFGDQISAPSDCPVRTGYIFYGWEPGVDIMDEEGKTFKAVWEMDLAYCRVVGITRETNEVYKAQNAEYIIKVYESAEKIQFSGASSVIISKPSDASGYVDDDLSEIGVVSIKTYDYNGNEVSPDSRDAYYEEWTVVAKLEEGYYKVRVNVDGTEDGWEIIDFAYDYDVVFEPKDFFLYLNANGGEFADGSSHKSILGIYGESIEDGYEEPSRDGYVFCGWKDEDGNEVIINGTMPDIDGTIYAQWAEVITGAYGNITYTYNETTGELVISGEGEIPEFFAYDEGLYGATSVIICDGITGIGNSAFECCFNLASVTIPDSVENIGNSAFNSCTRLESITIPDSVTSMGEWCFAFCDSLETVVIGDGLREIPDYAFASSYKINNITFGNKVEVIGDYAFNHISATSLTLPKSIKTISYDSFPYIDESLITDVYYQGAEEDWQQVSVFDEAILNATIHFADSSEPSGTYTVTFDADSGAFADGEYIKTVSVSDGETIEKYKENPTKQGFIFVGWVDDWGEYFDFENAEPNDYTLYAKWAEITGECDTVVYSYDSSTGELIVGGNGEIPVDFAYETGDFDATSLIICDGVTGIGRGAFGWYVSLESITIPDSVTSISDYAFEGCYNLTSVTIGNSVTSIGRGAFYYCESLESIIIPDSVTSIGDSAFGWCGSLESITIPDSVTSIGNFAFEGCSNLTTVTIPDSVTSIGKGAFADCLGLTSVTIGNGVTGIDVYTFSCCESLISVTIGNSVTSIDYSAFDFCNSLTTVTIPDSVTSIGKGAFVECYNLTDVYYAGTEAQWNAITIGDGNDDLTGATIHYKSSGPEPVSMFSLRSFFGLSKNDSGEVVFKVPETVTEIGDYAFMYSNATKVKIPASVTKISETAFAEAAALEYIDVDSKNEAYEDKNGILFTGNGDEIVAYPRALTDSSYTLPIGTKSIGAYAFNGSVLEKIYLPSSLETIGDYAFCNSYSLTYADIEDNVTYIGDYAFYGCSLETADMPDDLISVGDYAFFGSRFTDVEISESVTDIGAFAFAGNFFLEEIAVNKNNISYESDSNGVLYNKGQSLIIQYPAASANTEFVFPETVSETADMAFCASENLSSVVLNDNLAFIGDYTFDGCSSVKEFIMPDGVERIGDGAFNGCNGVMRMKLDAKFADSVDFREMATLMDLQFTGDTSSITIPEQIINFEAAGSYDNIQLAWSKSFEARSTSYRIFRRDENGSDWSLLATINSRTTLDYIDSTAEEDVIYKYAIVTVDEVTGIISPVSREATCSKSDDTVPPVVTKVEPGSLSYISGEEKITVYAADDLMMSKVTLQYSIDNGLSWELIGTDYSSPYTFTLDTTVLSDGVIRVKALAYDTSGNQSEPMTLSYTVDNMGPQKITGLKVKESTATSINVAWDDVEAGDAAVFVIQMKNDDGTYKTIADSIPDLSYTVSDLAPDTDYIFRVAAKDERGNLGEYSDDFTFSTSSDAIAPDTKNLLPTLGRHNKDISFKVTATDNYAIKSIAVQVSTDKINWETVGSAEYTDFSKSKNFSCVIKISDYNDGSIFVRAVATDCAGNNNVDDGSFDMVEYIVDTTAPSSPEGLYAAGGDGWIYLRWEIGSETDLYTYSVYRSTEENGNYALIANYLAKYDYYDTTVSRDTVYYYKIRVIDTLGNISDFSSPVAAKVADDIAPPQIISINPVSGKEVSPISKTISVYAKDNASLASIMVEYKVNDAEEYTLIENFAIEGKNSVTAKCDLPVNAMVHGDRITVHVVVTDITGLTAEQTVEYTYVVDTEAPVISNLGVTVDGDYCKITWNDPTDTDASGYRIYRVNADGTFTELGSRAKSSKHSYTFYDNVSILGTGDYAYKVEAYDASGNMNSYITEPVHYEYVPDEDDGGGNSGGNEGEEPENPDEPINRAPNITITAYSVLEVGVEEYFDAGGSYDDSQVVSFLWDFGDGTTSNEVKAAKKYTAVGDYTVTLTITDDGGLSTTATFEVTVHEREALGTVKVTVVDSNGKVVPDAKVIFDAGSDNEKAVATDQNGVASLKMKSGTYTVCVRVEDYVPDIKQVTVLPNAERRITLRFIEQKIVEGEFEVKRLTHEEVEAAGIDVSDYDNQNFYQTTVTIQYGGSTIPLNYIRNDKEIISSTVTGGNGSIIGSLGGDKDDEEGDNNVNPNPNPSPIPPIPVPDPDPYDGHITINTDSGQKELTPVLIPNDSGEELIMMLEMPVGARSLKEMFEVSLYLFNNAYPTFTLLENEITLNLPDGLSLVKNSPSKERVTLDTIEDGAVIRWLVKGDKEGDYNLTADYNGKLSLFKDAPVTASFSKNIKVYGMSDVKINVQVSDEIRYNAFYFNIGLENDGTVDQLNLNLDYDGVVRNISASTLQRMAQEENGEEGEIDTSNDFEVNATLMNVRYVYADGTYSYIPYTISDGHVITGINTVAPGEAIYYEYVAYNAINYDGVAVFKDAAVDELSKYSSNVTVTSISMDLYDKLNVVERLTKYGSADKASLDYLITDGKYFYWNQATGTAENSIGRALYNCTNAVLGTRWKELNHEQKYTLAEKVLLHHFAGVDVIENIGDLVEEKYVFLVQRILSDLKSGFVSDDFEENANVQAALEWIENAIYDYELIAELGAAIRMKGAEGLKGDLIAALCVAGEAQLVKYDSLAFLSDDYVVNVFAGLCDYSKELLNPAILDPVKRVGQGYFNQYVYNVVQSSVCVEIVKSITAMFEKYADKSFLDSDYVGIVKVISEKYASVAESKNLALVSALSDSLRLLGYIDDVITENMLVEELLSPISNRTNYLYTILDIAYDSFKSIAGIGREYLSEDIITLAECVSTVFVNAWIDHNAEYEYNGQTLEAAVDASHILMYLAQSRLAGESLFKEFATNIEEDFLISLNEELHSDYESIEEVYDEVYKNILEARDTLFNIEETEAAEKPEAPVVSINYETLATNEKFDETYEYCYSDGEWQRCNGEEIPVKLKSHTSVLRVRKASADGKLSGEITTVNIWGQREMRKNISVKYDNGVYYFTNLSSLYNYQICPLEKQYDKPDWSKSVIVVGGYNASANAEFGRYLAIRSCENTDKKELASKALILDVNTKQLLTVSVWGNGTVTQSAENGRYFIGEDIYLTANPNESVFEGWYIDGQRVSGDKNYILEMYEFAEIVAKFSGSSDVLPESANLSILTDNEIYSLTSGQIVPMIFAGAKGKLIADITPENATDKSVEWKSSNENVAVINANGVISFLRSGTVTVTATLANGITESAKIKVLANGVEECYIDSMPYKTTYYEDEQLDLDGLVLKAKYTNGAVEEVRNYTVEGFDNSVGEKTVILSYMGVNTELKVKVIHNCRYTVSKEATCTEEGVKTKYCVVCGVIVDTQSIPVTEHTCKWVITKEATPETKGVKELICTVCGASTKTESVDYCEHEFNGVNVPAECGKEGYTIYTCSKCGYEKTDDYTEALTHSYTETVIKPTCTTNGFTVQICRFCSDKIVVSRAEATGHNYVEEQIETSCSSEGYTLHTCQNCGNSYKTNLVKKLPHTYTEEVTEPTCYAKGYTTHTCSVCEYSYVSDEVNMIAHEYESEKMFSDCTQGGHTLNTCKVCGETTKTDIIEPAEHEYGEWIIKTPSSESATGLKYRICTVCEIEETQIIPVVDHEHIPGEWITETSASCDDYGIKVRRCEKCREIVETEIIPSPGHNYSSTVISPTCTTDGYTVHHCSECGKTYTDSTVLTTGHAEGEWVVEVEADCDNNGLRKKYCTVCEELTAEETVPYLNHSSWKWQTETEATCTESGLRLKICDYCDKCMAEEIIPASGHEYSVNVTPKTCTEDGVTTYTCSNCLDSYETDRVKATGHISGDWTVSVEPTVETEGKREKRCKVCGDLLDSAVIPTLKEPITGITISEQELEIVCEEAVVLVATVTPENAIDKTVIWSSDNPGVAHVDENGKITATTPGTATVTASTANGEFSASCEITVISNMYKVSWIVDGETITETVRLGTEIEPPVNPEKKGYTFEGWTPDIPEAMPKYDLEFTAIWSANSYNALFDANGGKWSDGETTKTVSVAYDSQITAPEAPSREGFVFAGWDKTVDTMNSTDGKIFKAVWTSKNEANYTVETYIMNTEGVYEKSVQVLAGIGGSVATVNFEPEAGLTVNTEKSVLTGMITADNALVLKVYIDREIYTFTTVIDGVSTSADYYYGAVLGEIIIPEKNGYVFEGWDKTVPQTMPASDLTVTAVFKALKTSVKIDNNPGSATIKHGESLYLTATMTEMPDGAYLVWYVDGVEKVHGTAFELNVSEGTVTVEVKAVDKDGNVMVDENGNEISDSQTVTVNSSIWQKIVSFFKNLFRMDRTIVQSLFRNIF